MFVYTQDDIYPFSVITVGASRPRTRRMLLAGVLLLSTSTPGHIQSFAAFYFNLTFHHSLFIRICIDAAPGWVFIGYR
jgi:hypothetical protein